MKLMFGLIGAVVGGVLGNLSGALAMALLGALAGWGWAARATAKPSSAGLDAATLLRRIVALEQELAALRGRVATAPSTPTATTVEPTPAEAPPALAAMPAPVAVSVARAPAPRVVEAPRPALVAAPAPVAERAAPRRAVPSAPAVPLRERLPPFVARWIFGGNTIVKAGVLILFLGLAFLLRYTAQRVTLPVEFRYAGVALVGIALTAVGWRLRDRRDAAGGTGYGLILQGAGIGVFYLTTLGALRLDPLLSPNLAFAFMAAVAVVGALLAVLQDAPWLALVSVAEGFAAPVLVSTGSTAYAPLMSYMAILDAGILAMAWFKAWRPLNLVGAVATFALAGAWAHEHYVAADYAGVQAWLVLFFLLFTLTGVLFARRALAVGDAPPAATPLAERARDALRHLGRVDSTLTFGVPLAAFSLQYLLVRDMAWGPAWAATAFALLHIALGGVLMRAAHPRYALLGEAHVIVGTIFGTLAVPLALQGVWTGATWSIEAAGMYWLGARQQRTYARAFALAVVLGAAVRLTSGLSLDLRDDVPLVTGSTLGIAMLAVALCAMDVVRRRVAEAQRGQVEEIAAASVPFAAAFAFALLAWMLCPMLWAGAITAWIACGCAALTTRSSAPSLRVASVLLHLGALTAMTVSLQRPGGESMSPQHWRDLAAALAIGGALLATGWLGLRDAWRAATAGAPRAVPLASSIGLVAGLAVACASLLFVLSPDSSALPWALVGLASAVIGARLRSGALVGAAFGLQAAAGVASLLFAPSAWSEPGLHVAVVAPLWVALALAIVALVLGDLLRRDATSATRAWWHAGAIQWALVAWAMWWWSRVLPPLVWRALAASPAPALDSWPHWQLIWLTLTAVAAVAIARWRDWAVLGRASMAALPLWILFALSAPESIAPSAHLGWLAWPLALLAHPGLMRMQARWRAPVLSAPSHVAGAWLFIALAAQECVLRVQAVAAPGSSWPDVAAMVVPALALVASAQPALQRRLHDEALRAAWLVAGCGALALYLFGWLWVSNASNGDATPLPWVPLLNPLEIGQGVALLALVAWVRALPARWRDVLPAITFPALGGLTAFGLVTGLVLRTCHHWAGVPWNADALFASTLAQAALSVTWSLIGVALMVAGHRGLRRELWAVGAVLLGVVVAKLFLIELADRGNLSRIVSFIVVGVLMLAVGYFAPIPPRRVDDEAATPDALGGAA